MRLLCFGKTNTDYSSVKDNEPPAEGFLDWRTDQIQTWLAQNGLQRLQRHFQDMQGKDLLLFTPEKCQQIVSSPQQCRVLVKCLQVLKAHYVDSLVRQGIPLQLTPTSIPQPANNDIEKNEAEINNSEKEADLKITSKEQECQSENEKIASNSVQNPIKDVMDPTKRMQIVCKQFIQNFGIRGKAFTTEEVHQATGIPTTLVHDVVNILQSVQIISPLNQEYVWWGTQRLQLQNQKSLRSSCENLFNKYHPGKSVLNLSVVTPWVIEVVIQSEKDGKERILVAEIVDEILQQCPVDSIVTSRDRLTHLVRDTCIVLVATGVLDEKHGDSGYAVSWNLSADENLDPSKQNSPNSASNQTKQRMGTAVNQSKKYFDVPGQIPMPQHASSHHNSEVPILETQQFNSSLQIQEASQQLPKSTIETDDPGSVTTLRSKFAQLNNQESS
eukprot:TRINITY_DN6548_c0_g1_i1.p1 TRINITY_DN6548_c0_g1~~TRINITY_DN6548_c0_g1_i1.p1  ORF type:complete len:503 (-),score=28.04 TRINITY_DN6548_c0_g1_i1:406-1734(-)